MSEGGKYIQIATAMRCEIYDSSEARTESSRERERERWPDGQDEVAGARCRRACAAQAPR